MDKKITIIVCAGDSVTYGETLDDVDLFSYPAQLEMMLGNDYVVGNMGRTGATVMLRGAIPFISTPECATAASWAPDILVVCLGTNDTVLPFDDEAREAFVRDYADLIRNLKEYSPSARTYLCMIPPIPRYDSLSGNVREVNALIGAVARECGASVIDLHTPFLGKEGLFTDGVHPNERGARLIAGIVFEALAENLPQDIRPGSGQEDE